MDCVFDWNINNIDEWQDRYASIRRANLLQSYDYARATCIANSQQARWGIISIDGKEAGMFQILEAGILGNLFHATFHTRGLLKHGRSHVRNR